MWNLIERWTSDGAEQNCVCAEARSKGFRRERFAELLEGDASDGMRGERNLMAEGLRDPFKHFDGFIGDFRPDAVARESDDLEVHAGEDGFQSR